MEMTCPKCSGRSMVVDVKHIDNETHRRKRCKYCGHVFFTLELIADDGTEFYDAQRKYERKRK